VGNDLSNEYVEGYVLLLNAGCLQAACTLACSS